MHGQLPRLLQDGKPHEERAQGGADPGLSMRENFLCAERFGQASNNLCTGRVKIKRRWGETSQREFEKMLKIKIKYMEPLPLSLNFFGKGCASLKCDAGIN